MPPGGSPRRPRRGWPDFETLWTFPSHDRANPLAHPLILSWGHNLPGHLDISHRAGRPHSCFSHLCLHCRNRPNQRPVWSGQVARNPVAPPRPSWTSWQPADPQWGTDPTRTSRAAQPNHSGWQVREPTPATSLRGCGLASYSISVASLVRWASAWSLETLRV